MSKPSLILFDTETSGGRGLADILTIDALFFDYNFKKLDEFSCTARMRKSRVYEVDSFLVNGLDPFELDKCSNSNFDLTKKTNDKFISWIDGPSWITLAVVVVGFFGVRFFGQGVLTSCSRNLLLPWFVKRRGLVSGLRNVFVSFGFSIAPLGIAGLIAFFGWRETLWGMALIVGLIFSVLALIFIRDNPASCDLAPDGEIYNPAYETSSNQSSLNLRDARRSLVFWVYSLSLAMHALFGTALTFHVVAIFSEAGLTKEIAFGYFIPVAIFSTSANLLASWLVDSSSLKPFLILMLGSFILGSFGFLFLDLAWGYWALASGFGVGGGLWSVVSNLAFIRFFGPNHVGEVSGFSTSISVFASALGPFIFSAATDIFGSYGAAAQICLLLLLVLLVAAIIIPQKELSGLHR